MSKKNEKPENHATIQGVNSSGLLASRLSVEEIINKMDNFSEEERVKFLGALSKQFCYLSRNTLMDFQRNWNTDKKSYEQFIKEQNKVFRSCVEIEISETGDIVRTALGLDQLTLDTIIEAC